MTKRPLTWTLGCWLVVSALAGCAQAPVKPEPPRKVALMLGGGGARGFAHIGVIRELEAEKVPIDLIIGVSVGSLIGALYADQPDSFQLEWKAFQISQKEIFDFRIINFLDSLAGGEALQTYLDKNLKSRYLEDLKIPLVAVAADLKTGQRYVFRNGAIRTAVRASTSIPGVFPPVPYQDMLLVDGGVLGNLTPQVARDLGATFVIGVNLARSRAPNAIPPATALNVVLESLEIMGEEMARLNKDRFDVLIEPQVGTVGVTDFTKKRELIDAGRQAAKLVIPRIKQLLDLK